MSLCHFYFSWPTSCTHRTIGRQGRIVIPSSLRQQLAIKPGSQLLAWLENGRLIMEAKEQLW
ncbi:MAG TPA: AbrB/MazE/SpoVT family DNA-binding domain-containing protein [Methyloprofundus sp.]|nr:AbrB/MazE/SpoVT family DNA-binding domain-containing protein [Methyloprofundus sp.]HIL78366.1 AbrB/MazE/SpoVT family DNA-binding domain-containing protein [Methylococcales bacterium]